MGWENSVAKVFQHLLCIQENKGVVVYRDDLQSSHFRPPTRVGENVDLAGDFAFDNWQPDFRRRSLAEDTFQDQSTAGLFCHSMDHREPQTRALADALGREK